MAKIKGQSQYLTETVFRGQRNVEKPGAASEIEEDPG